MIRDVHSPSRCEARKAMRSRAWLNGEEVTSRCFYADDRAGVVRLYRLNAEGKKFVEPILNAPHWDVPMRAATEELHGRVEIGRSRLPFRAWFRRAFA